MYVCVYNVQELQENSCRSKPQNCHCTSNMPHTV